MSESDGRDSLAGGGELGLVLGEDCCSKVMSPETVILTKEEVGYQCFMEKLEVAEGRDICIFPTDVELGIFKGGSRLDTNRTCPSHALIESVQSDSRERS